jgi:hypothetical protein
MEPQPVVPIGYFDERGGPVRGILKTIAISAMVFGVVVAASIVLTHLIFDRFNVGQTIWQRASHIFGLVAGLLALLGGALYLAKSTRTFFLMSLANLVIYILNEVLAQYDWSSGGANSPIPLWQGIATSVIYAVLYATFPLTAFLVVWQCKTAPR